ncbi:hypothetical protein FZEAL_8207 [Fusarium zealandicum]|uniref:Uncharacterized protein n=1 Tax=Fusarium zealandicum TaxID=1053134 RepID=A0A8H4XI30_9HYPO|nr:hypothetical protein FZEAL_8207 [Fusarium zealandicum]
MPANPSDAGMYERDLENLMGTAFDIYGSNYGGGEYQDDLSTLEQFLHFPDPENSVSQMPPNESFDPAKNAAVMSPPAMRSASLSWEDGFSILDEYIKSELLDVAGSDQNPPSQTVTPATECFEVVTPKPQLQRPVSLPVTYGTQLEADRPPKKHRIQSPPTAETTDPHSLLKLLGDTTFRYQGHISSQRYASNLRVRYDSLSHQGVRTTSRPETDRSFPQTDQEYRNRICEAFEAICDWSSHREWRAKMGQKRVKNWLAEVVEHRQRLGLVSDLSRVCDDDIVPPIERMPSVAEQWKNVIHRRMSDVEIELLCAQILFNKVLIHSAMRASWISRITNSPYSETRRKYQNKAGNDRKRTLIEQGGSEKKKTKTDGI